MVGRIHRQRVRSRLLYMYLVELWQAAGDENSQMQGKHIYWQISIRRFPKQKRDNHDWQGKTKIFYCPRHRPTFRRFRLAQSLNGDAIRNHRTRSSTQIKKRTDNRKEQQAKKKHRIWRSIYLTNFRSQDFVKAKNFCTPCYICPWRAFVCKCRAFDYTLQQLMRA